MMHATPPFAMQSFAAQYDTPAIFFVEKNKEQARNSVAAGLVVYYEARLPFSTCGRSFIDPVVAIPSLSRSTFGI